MNEIQHKLSSLAKEIKDIHISDLHNYRDLEDRIIRSDLIDFDYSKQKLNDKVLEYLLQIPDEINLKESLKDLFEGVYKNPSEKRLVSHTLYRNETPKDYFELIFSERERIKSFLENNKTNLNIKDLICIGIGGSRLGPELLNEFQSSYGSARVHFCSSYDLLELDDILKNVKQRETIIFVSSKSFETSEILKNLEYVKSWYKRITNLDFKDHLYGISSNASAMTALGIKESNQFLILDSLGGRFSLWSSMSLPAFFNSNYDSYLNFLQGARMADVHAKDTSWESNIPVIMALLSIWNTDSLNINNHGIFTYNYRLRSLTKYIAQLAMESNGKSVNFKSQESPFATTPLIWGGYGIESQHSTFQWLMQGKMNTACDFIIINDERYESEDIQEMMLSQVLAMTHGENNKKQPYKSVRGNNPSSVIQLNSYELKNLGFLLAVYEHKTFVEALIVGIDPFDQWGVELGKKLSNKAKEDKGLLSKFFSKSLFNQF